MDTKLLPLLVFAALIAFSVYRRVRRTIGRQPLQPKRMQFRVGLFVVIGIVIGVFSLRDLDLFAALGLGVAAGALLGWFGLRYTKFEITEQGKFYTPHTYIGLLVSLLLIG